MAGEFTGYYTYEAAGSNRRLKGMYGTQDAADTAGGLDSSVTANLGSTEFPNGIRIGWLWDTTNSEWRQEATADLSDVDQLKAAAHAMMDVFDDALGYIERNRLIWTADLVEKAIEGIHWQAINTARICLNGTRLASDRQKICEESASWPADTNGDVRQYVDAFAADSIGLPTKDWFWIDLTMDSPVRVAVGDASVHFSSTMNVEDAPTSDKLIGRVWIDDIPA